MSNRFKNKVAVITGAAQGIGKRVAEKMAKEKGVLVLVDRAEIVHEVAESLKKKTEVLSLTADLEKFADCQRVMDEAVKKFGRIDILINNVGGRRINTPTEDLALEDWQRIIDLNLTQAFILTKRLGGAMIPRKWGRIINIASINALWPGKAMRGRSYETSKGALAMFTKAVAADWAVHGITVNAIAPGPFLTDANRRWIGERPEFEGEVATSIPMGRWGRPEEIGPLALYLASEASSFMTGSVLVLDGGKLLW